MFVFAEPLAHFAECVHAECTLQFLRFAVVCYMHSKHYSNLTKAAYENGLSGFEFASGIPGSLGGAVVMKFQRLLFPPPLC